MAHHPLYTRRSTLSQSHPLFIGMDVHNDAIAVASVAQDHGAEVSDLGSIGTRQGAIDPLVRQRQSKAHHLMFVSAAGPCGDWLSRSRTKPGYDCWVVAPSLIPHKPGARVKTDRRDAVQLARLARSGDRTAVYGPKVAEDALRALTRARAEASSDLPDAPFRRQAFWLRHALRSPGRAHGGPAPLRWRSDGVCPTPTPPSVFQEDVRAVHAHTDRLQRLEHARHEPVQAWRLSPVVEALQAWRGVPCTVAVTLVAAMGDLPRFDPPRALRHFLGLLPSASSSGEQRRQGALTQAGNTPARRVRVAGAWASRSPAHVSRHWPLRLATPPTIIQAISGKAQVRRCKRSRRLVSRGQHATGVTGAMARALAGCLGAMAREVSITP